MHPACEDLAEAHLNASESPFRLGQALGQGAGRRGGSRTTNRAPPSPRGGDRDRPAVGGDDLLDDGQPESAPAGVAGARLVEPHEPLEDPFPLVLRDPGTVVVDAQLHLVACLPDGHRDRCVGMAGGVVDEVADHLRERGPVAPDPAGCHTGRVDVEPVAAYPARLGERQVVEVDVMEGAEDRPLVGPGEQQELFDETLHPRRLLEHGVRQLALGQGTRMGARDLGRLPDARERRAQLVGGVGDELLLPVAGVLETSEHLVHGQREPVDLVAGARLGHPPVQPVAGDLLDLAPDSLDRCERPGGHHPGGAADDQQHQRARRPAAAESAQTSSRRPPRARQPR